MIFATLEDETGVANIIVWPKVFEANRRVVLGARVLGVKGTLQREGIVIHVIAKEFVDLTSDMASIAGGADIGERIIARADEGKTGGPSGRNREQEQFQEAHRRRLVDVLPAGRNFH
jgi:error-prone DNA polymerase